MFWETGTEMKYSWVTQLDDDGKSWSLVSSTSPKVSDGWAYPSFTTQLTFLQLSTNVESRLDDGMERFVFYNFLHVLYARPCDAGYHYQFLALFTMADYYAALPALSRILGSALLCSPGLVMTINDEALELFPLAAKLRNPMLFRECLVWLCSNWEAPEYRDLKETHPELYKLADRAYDGICRIVAHCGDVVRKWEGKLDNDCQSYVQELRREIFSYPEYLKRIYLLEYFEGDLDSMAQLKVIRLRLHYYVSYNFERLFLFADIKDEDLPWDPTEIEW